MKLGIFLPNTSPRQREEGHTELDATVMGNSDPQIPPELSIDGHMLSLEEAVRAGYAILSASVEERRTLGRHPFPVGMQYLITLYKEKHQCDDEGVAKEVNCPVEGVALLKRYMEPGPRQQPFVRDVTAMEQAIGVQQRTRLANFVNLARMLDRLRTFPPAPGTPFLAHVTYADGGGDGWISGEVK